MGPTRRGQRRQRHQVLPTAAAACARAHTSVLLLRAAAEVSVRQVFPSSLQTICKVAWP
jgi:hypothetical protein